MHEAEAAAERRDWSKAAALLADAGDSTEVLERRAFYLSRAGSYDEAIELLGRVHGRKQGSARVPYMIGFQYAQKEEWPRAIEWYERGLQLAPDYLKAHYRLAQAQHRAGHDLKAQIAAANVLKLWHRGDEEFRRREQSKLARASHLLGKLQLRADPEGAVELLRQAVEYEPKDPNKLYALGKALTRAGHAEEALEPLTTAKRMEPRKTFIEVELVRALAESGQQADALSRLHAVAHHCRGWDAYNGGKLAQLLGDAALARQLLERALRRGPTKGNPVVEDRLRSLPGDAVSTKTASGESSGEVVLVNRGRGFGFLVDEDGVKRHFRLDRSRQLRKGSRVTFTGAEQKKGPAAHDVRAAA